MVRVDAPQAWTQLNEQFAPAVYRWCLMDGVPRDDAAELVQEVLLCVFEGLEGFSRNGPEDSFRAWMRRITQNRIIDWRRAAAVRPAPSPGGTTHHRRIREMVHPPDPDTASSVDPELAEFEEVTERVRASVEEHTWQIFTYHVIDRFTSRETADEYGVSESYVYVVRARVLRRYREEMERVQPSSQTAAEP